MTEKFLNWYKSEPPDFKNVPEKPGIYLISTMQTDNEFEVKYVGQADNLRARVTGHWHKNEKNKELRQHIAEKYIMKVNYTLIDSKSDRDGMELYLYNLYKPQYNKNRPLGKTAISCTIPVLKKQK